MQPAMAQAPLSFLPIIATQMQMSVAMENTPVAKPAK